MSHWSRPNLITKIGFKKRLMSSVAAPLKKKRSCSPGLLGQKEAVPACPCDNSARPHSASSAGRPPFDGVFQRLGPLGVGCWEVLSLSSINIHALLRRVRAC